MHLGERGLFAPKTLGAFFEEGGRPDILIEKSDGWPIVIEAEVGNYRQAEIEARSRLGNRLISTGNYIHASVALIYPEALRSYNGSRLRTALREVQLEFCLYTSQANEEIARFPPDGWLSGGVAELAILLHRSSIPAWRVEALSDALEHGGKPCGRNSHRRAPNWVIVGR